MSEKPRVGRKPSGIAGQCVKDYPQLAVRVPKETIDELKNVSKELGWPQWRVVHQALSNFAKAVHTGR